MRPQHATSIFTTRKTCTWILVLCMAISGLPGVASARRDTLPDDECIDKNEDERWDRRTWNNNYLDMWYLKRINAHKAWKFSEGEGIKIAHISSGVDLDHEDLQGQIEIDAFDQRTGYDNSDTDGIGTAAAGIMVALKNNGRGVAGVAPKATLIPYRVTEMSRLWKAHERAAYGSADVIHYSLGAHEYNVPGLYNDPYKDNSICQFAEIAAWRGKIVVAPVGNGDGNGNGDPTDLANGFTAASCPAVIAVGASPLRQMDNAPRKMTDRNNPSASFSNFGANFLHLVAPGGNGTSADPGSAPRYEHNNIVVLRARNPHTGDLVSPVRDGIAGPTFSNGTPKRDITSSVALDGQTGHYMRWRGTDLAAAQVSGTVALMLSAAPTLRALPGYSRLDAVRRILKETARGTRKPTATQGHGRLDAEFAVKKAIDFDECLVQRVGGGVVTGDDGYACIQSLFE